MSEKITMPWEERPEGCTDVMWRYSKNPVIGRYAIPTSNSIFNSAVVPFKDGYAGVFRCDNKAVQMNIFAGFRASIISSKRKLTRMKPNRRTGFDNMGSVRRFDTKLLVAVDVSGSVSTKSLQYFYGVINSAFRYGFESIDVIQFDCGIKAVHSLKNVVKDVAIVGRGGTSFQEPVDYAHENGYDGLIMLTDGYAPPPCIPEGFKTGILWVCENEECLEHHKSWMEKTGRTCVMQIG